MGYAYRDIFNAEGGEFSEGFVGKSGRKTVPVPGNVAYPLLQGQKCGFGMKITSGEQERHQESRCQQDARYAILFFIAVH
jgi:hypothetical protein